MLIKPFNAKDVITKKSVLLFFTLTPAKLTNTITHIKHTKILLNENFNSFFTIYHLFS